MEATTKTKILVENHLMSAMENYLETIFELNNEKKGSGLPADDAHVQIFIEVYIVFPLLAESD